jgi:putative hemolysin
MVAILILFCLILLNGIFVMAEIALVSARKSKLEDMASKGDVKAKAALELTENPELYFHLPNRITQVATGLLFW